MAVTCIQLYILYMPQMYISISQARYALRWSGGERLHQYLYSCFLFVHFSPLRPPTPMAAAVSSYSICLQMTQAFLNRNYLGNSLLMCFYSQEFLLYAFWLTCLIYCIYRFSIAIYLLKKYVLFVLQSFLHSIFSYLYLHVF